MQQDHTSLVRINQNIGLLKSKRNIYCNVMQHTKLRDPSKFQFF